MYNTWFTSLHHRLARPAFRIYGKGRREAGWRVLSVIATHRRNWDSGWLRPFFAGTAITWTDAVIACGWDFAAEVLMEQREDPATPERPVEVRGGRMRDARRRAAVSAPAYPSYSEVIAHEVGHSAQARRLSWLYLPKGAVFTLWREGDGWWHRFENEASEQGLFGGVVAGSVHPRLADVWGG